MNSIEDAILIVSHPDDECLFASSLLDKISKLIICFEKIPNEDRISLARKYALNDYPLKNIELINLGLTQSTPSIFPNNWFNIKDKYSGIKGGYKKKTYDENYNILISELRKNIRKKSLIISHNPWGEYGHEEHCQVFKAAYQISNETKSDFYVSGYWSNLSKCFAKRKFHLLTNEYFFLKTNLEIFEKLKKHYLNKGCWTWYRDYSLPSMELFYKVNLNLNPESISNLKKCHKVPLLFINNNNQITFYIREIIKKLVPFCVKDFFRKGRVYLQ